MAIVRKIKKCIFALTALSLLSAALPLTALAARDPEILGESVLLVEASSGAVLYEKNADERRSPDSLSKIMTLLVAVIAVENDEAELGSSVTAEDSAWDDVELGNSKNNILPGETLTLIDLLHIAFMTSADEACNILAAHIAGSVPEFVDRMNSLALNLGCRDTFFTNPHGKANPGQYSTARDLYRILSEARSHALWNEIAGIYKYRADVTDIASTRDITNSNFLLSDQSKYYYRYCTAGRVSVTFEAGYGIAAAAAKADMPLIAVILGARAVTLEDESTELQNLSEARRLFEWGFEHFSWQIIVSKDEPVTKIPVLYGDGADYVNLRPSSEIRMLLDNDVISDLFTRNVQLDAGVLGGKNALEAPVKEGTLLGKLVVSYQGRGYGTVDLVADTSVGLLRIKFIENNIRQALGKPWVRVSIAVVALLFILYIGLVLRFNHLRKKRIRAVAATKRRLAEERKNQVDYREFFDE
jgi:D-alanyl-D-alanine carboxypeptidase (penicillin-binding protein 5/6)